MPVSIAFKGIVPKRSFATLGEKVQEQLRAQVRRDAEGIKQDFEATTATWSHRVRFAIRHLAAAGDLVALVGTDDEIYGFVNFGTRAHLIRPRRAKMLAFPGGPYKAKTKVGWLGSRSGGATGPVVHARAVQHPGTAARKFTETIQKKWQREIPKEAAQAVRGAIQSW